MATRDPETSPTAFLGAELRRARMAAGFSSQEALAARLGFDRTVVSKSENGDRVPSADVLSAWCSACQITEPELFTRLAVLARRVEGMVPPWFEGWLEAEREAHTLQMWSPVLMPGLLQTAEYAHALFVAAGFGDDQAAQLVTARLERQAVLSRPDPPEVCAVIDETVLHRLIGSAATMADQLAHVADVVAEHDHVSVQVLPATGANAGLSGAFDLAGTDGLVETVRLESVEDRTTQDRALVRRAAVVFDRVRRDALPRVPSRDRILEAAEKWKTT
jgi:transcriptional regulator with XRE-family HTH domain